MKQRAPIQVLIIDADNVRRGMLACTLPSTRYTLEFAKTGEAGLDRLQVNAPELILIGHDEGTRDLCQHLRSLPAARDCTLVLLDEAFRDEEAGLSAAEASGADLALAFPFTLQELKTALARHARASHVSVEALEVSELVNTIATPEADEEPDDEEPATADDEERAWEAFRARVADLFENLATRNYYELLDVGQEASPAEIKDAYFERSIDFHPDRFMQLDDATLRQHIYEVFKRLTEAFKVLLDPDARSGYDRQLASDEDDDTRLRYVDFGRARRASVADDSLASTPAGRKYVNFAELAERGGNLKSARMYLTLATQCEPRNTALRARLDEVTRSLGR